MKHYYQLLFPSLNIYNPIWVNKLPTDKEQIRSLYIVIFFLSLVGGLSGAVFGRYLPIKILLTPVCWIVATISLYRLYNILLTDFRKALLKHRNITCVLMIGKVNLLSILMAHMYSLLVFEDNIHLAILATQEAKPTYWAFFIESIYLFKELIEPSVLLLWIWVQAITQILFSIPFVLLIINRNNLHTHLYHVKQTLIENAHKKLF